jgi:hypothetical protein
MIRLQEYCDVVPAVYYPCYNVISLYVAGQCYNIYVLLFGVVCILPSHFETISSRPSALR